MTKLQYPLCGPQVYLQRAVCGPRAACLTCLFYMILVIAHDGNEPPKDRWVVLWHFEGTYCLHSERPSWSIWPLRMKLIRSPEMSVNTHPKTRRRISETRNSPLRLCENLKPRVLWVPQRPNMYCNCLGDSQMLSTHSGPSVERCLTCCIALDPAGDSSCAGRHIWPYVTLSESCRHSQILVLHP